MLEVKKMSDCRPACFYFIAYTMGQDGGACLIHWPELTPAAGSRVGVVPHALDVTAAALNHGRTRRDSLPPTDAGRPPAGPAFCERKKDGALPTNRERAVWGPRALSGLPLGRSNAARTAGALIGRWDTGDPAYADKLIALAMTIRQAIG